ncbi:MAG: hypothetical protein MI861_11040, partial [Pirellulales bacterium]|nr:hypothetical protein [Pirellulales bacterium]
MRLRRLAVLIAMVLAFGSQIGVADENSRAAIRLTTCDPPFRQSPANTDGQYFGNLMHREIPRQALLLCAMHQFGLVIQDDTLRENAAKSDQDTAVYDLQTESISAREVRYELSREGEVLLTGVLPWKYTNGGQALNNLLHSTYQWTQGELPKFFKSQGYSAADVSEERYAHPHIPPEVYVPMRKMDVLSQAHAVRVAHRLIEQQGVTKGLLGALARGYANLAQLCDSHPTQMRYAFSARSLIYASWMIEKEPESPWGYWHRGYAYTMMGYNREGWLDWDLGQKKKRTPATPFPSWGKFVGPTAWYDFAKLDRLAGQEKNHYELATLLWYRSLEFCGSEYLSVDAGLEASSRLPHCTRIIMGINRFAGVSVKHDSTSRPFQHFGEGLEEQLNLIAKSNESVAKTLESFEDDILQPLSWPKIRDRLLAVAEEKPDSSPISVEVLARLIEDELFSFVVWRAHFLRHSLAVESSDFVTVMRPFYQDHPHGRLLEAFRLPRRASVDDYAPIFDDFECPEGNALLLLYPIIQRLPRSLDLGAMTRSEYASKLVMQGSFRETDYLVYWRHYGEKSKTKRLEQNYRAVLPRSPLRKSLVVKHYWNEVNADPEKWFKRHKSHPVLAGAIAKKFASLGQYEDSVSWYWRYIAEVPEYEAYRRLAA